MYSNQSGIYKKSTIPNDLRAPQDVGAKLLDARTASTICRMVTEIGARVRVARWRARYVEQKARVSSLSKQVEFHFRKKGANI